MLFTILQLCCVSLTCPGGAAAGDDPQVFARSLGRAAFQARVPATVKWLKDRRPVELQLNIQRQNDFQRISFYFHHFLRVWLENQDIKCRPTWLFRPRYPHLAPVIATRPTPIKLWTMLFLINYKCASTMNLLECNAHLFPRHSLKQHVPFRMLLVARSLIINASRLRIFSGFHPQKNHKKLGWKMFIYTWVA